MKLQQPSLHLVCWCDWNALFEVFFEGSMVFKTVFDTHAFFISTMASWTVLTKEQALLLLIWSKHKICRFSWKKYLNSHQLHSRDIHTWDINAIHMYYALGAVARQYLLFSISEKILRWEKKIKIKNKSVFSFYAIDQDQTSSDPQVGTLVLLVLCPEWSSIKLFFYWICWGN